MKLLFCTECQDIIKFGRSKRFCQCGASYAYYLDEVEAVMGGPAVPLGLGNSSLGAALRNRPAAGWGSRFEAFVIPEDCSSIKVEQPPVKSKVKVDGDV